MGLGPMLTLWVSCYIQGYKAELSLKKILDKKIDESSSMN